KKHRKRKSWTSPRKEDTSIKPIPPKEYDGVANPCAYHRFVMEGEAYLQDGNVSTEHQIRILVHFLDGKVRTLH
ncbi:hypothetical protein BYT27DRAFT_7066484, partial [Phlegmacium glaucopus]